jgi:hypothetical protein
VGLALRGGVTTGLGARFGGLVATCGSASGGTYLPNVGSPSGVGAVLCADLPADSDRSRTGSSRSPNAITDATSTGTANAAATTATRLPRGGSSPTGSSAPWPFGCPRCRPVTGRKRTHTAPARPSARRA